ncbi:hypothetical protein J437_LFUL007437 [Ladona fulva]|uniref:Dumpy n=1 Tax=Ladona fulva TaxID=123851 RepID=A0A8K0K4E5_LADFU|nr:hypothetical protein J437_LFUL007437 [Ladona fulva]
MSQKCRDPCPGSCGANAECRVVSHTPMCVCQSGYVGDPFSHCQPQQQEPVLASTTPCVPSPCGSNAVCREQNGAGACSCIQDYFGNPYEGCRPECVLSSDCASTRACIRNKCQDPCPGNCGPNADCQVVNHLPSCICRAGYTGNPFSHCSLLPIEPILAEPSDPCSPSPCGPNSQCRVVNGQGVCSCLPSYVGSPPGCRPECVVSPECPRDKACLNQKCVNPCPGPCGQNTRCEAINHSPICTCQPGYTGDPFSRCYPIPQPVVTQPCVPSPCGPNSQCREVNGQAVCSCVPGFIGSPPNCRPECITSSECSLNEACNNQKCRNPCPGTCGIGARCEVINHNPICSCSPRYTGDPFIRCHPIPDSPVSAVNPCQPSPCGPYAECRVIGDGPICSCLPEYKGSPPNCRPECISNAECPNHLACLNQKCRDPCVGMCGVNAMCRTVSHAPTCMCAPGFNGDPFVGCQVQLAPITQDISTPCHPSPCGANALCREQNGAGSCTCIEDHFGNPYEGCRPECVINSDCPSSRACIQKKCQDPCPGTCGQNANCQVVNHLPSCTCHPGYTGDPFRYCSPTPAEPIEVKDPCNPSPCGPNSQCREVNGQAVCSCLPTYIGSPPGCRPECTVSTECPQNKACINRKCADPCPGPCGQNTRCEVINHSPICVCLPGYSGDAFSRCNPIPTPPRQPVQPVFVDPCVPSPCGPFSECRDIGGVPSCSCRASYVGSPPNCRPECVISSECASNKACIREKCGDPCPGSCGHNAECAVLNHTPMCTCPVGYTGDPFSNCYPKPPEKEPVLAQDPCNPSPCGPNAQCRDGICSCLPEYQGDPYQGCRPECVLSSDCPRDKACIRQKCKNPCPGTCGQNAICEVANHIPICSCPERYSGNPFVDCRPYQEPVVTQPCHPSPCGPNSQCREINGQAVCSCVPGYIGSPPTCRPECVVSSECNQNEACSNQKCRNPCPGTCGVGAKCEVINHNPICSCPPRYTGDPFLRCVPMVDTPTPPPVNPCQPSPCGPYAECRVIGDSPSCSCLPNYIGSPPNCRPECVSNSECSSHLACINQKCKDPCPGLCGANAECRVVSHTPNCVCLLGYVGDPFTHCLIQQEPVEQSTPCVPSPCGANAVCREQNNAGACTCLPDYIGNPYEGCRPECVLNTDCPSNKACIGNKCKDPCPGTCGQNADCHVINHLPSCNCRSGYQGDPFRYCSLAPKEDILQLVDPCSPSPCGPNAQCRKVNDQAVCSCLPNYIGSPPGCRPECVVSSECPLNQACTNQKCVDPCPGTCGQNALCRVVNHVPICSCPEGQTGDPFFRCQIIPVATVVTESQPLNPCYPSPCGPHAQCQNVRGVPSCSCLPGYIGSPPGCRPECTINSECPSNLACLREKCRDPCPGSCGVNAQCSVINHTPICTCPQGYTGDPFFNCQPTPPVIEPIAVDPCNPSPCGPNAECRDGTCTCIPEYSGDPYIGCRPECILNSECPRNRACLRQKCVDPCIGTCGQGAECAVVNHVPICSCPTGTSGDPFILCRPFEEPVSLQPCNPSPCGPNSQCRVVNNVAVCSCLPEYIGSPPSCRPECVVNSECSLNEACSNRKCRDPCPGACGTGARCEVVNHNPICGCPPHYSGDPFVRCIPIVEEAPVKIDPCQPSPCGPNAECRVVGDSPSCSCLPEYRGSPPNCRPECVSNSECPNHLACINQKCSDPCSNACGVRAECRVVSHFPNCFCPSGFFGDAFIQCNPEPLEPLGRPSEQTNPCIPSPCGANAVCREQNKAGCRPECVLNSDCSTSLACIHNKCKNPCPGTCGQNAECRVINHLPSCTCFKGYTGDPFHFCSPVRPEPVVSEPVNPCSPSPCGPNAQCKVINEQAVCSCLPEYIGSPPSCRPECVVSSECPQNRACVNRKCIDPCPGACGQFTRCEVINHSPICSCREGHTGDPFSRCYPLPPPPKAFPCNPSPCGPNSQCREINDQAVCSCVIGYIGSPPNCRPECIVNSDCSLNEACSNQKCIDPCRGTCGIEARCQVINHSPICSCPPRYSGNPFTRCHLIVEQPVVVPTNPCQPSPCGPYAECKVVGDSPSCSCLANYVGTPPNCRPECVSNSECASHLACINQKCRDPCPGSCGANAECRVVSHTPNCICLAGYVGDPFSQCILPQAPESRPLERPCVPSPCGVNAICREQNGAGSCSCIPDHLGNPYEGCRPECLINTDCPSHLACMQTKCRDPCPGTCGQNAACQVINHLPSCFCNPGHTGDPFRFCHVIPTEVIKDPQDPCVPSPCGPNSQCRDLNGQAICSCLPAYVGSPPGCRPECIVSAECPRNKACIDRKCADPCINKCGINAICEVINHNPICACQHRNTGDPFTRCYLIQEPVIQPKPEFKDPCIPSPCGPYATCRDNGGYPSCSCLQNYIGSPPNCRPECVISSECSPSLACIREKCRDPCPGSCGQGALCNVINHTPVCTCPSGYTGDPFTHCYPEPPKPQEPVVLDPCNPSPCGPNARCADGVCTCLEDFRGDPYVGCRPECVLNDDCPRDKACIRNHCLDPCPGTCGQGARCDVINHIPSCSCPEGFTGDPFRFCRKAEAPVVTQPCQPSPCGPNSQCREVNGQAVCSCLIGYVNTPPSCRPECVVNSECGPSEACIMQKCRDPCPGTCGLLARCQVINHNPICSCPPGHTGDPFTRCYPIPAEPLPRPNEPKDPCFPSPCGPNSRCQPSVDGSAPSCSCLEGYLGSPPNCHPECTSNGQCASHLACINLRCRDPCPGSCGIGANCHVAAHIPNCVCPSGFTGDPFSFCSPVEQEPPRPTPTPNPCYPNPCGTNAHCRQEGNHFTCECLKEYHGNPYEGCRPECLVGSDCPANLACIRNKCKDPCPGTCGVNAICSVSNHIPICSCPDGYSGDAFRLCEVIRIHEPSDPCQPSPCGPGAICRVTPQGIATCECPPGLIGTGDLGCRPECVLDSDCPGNKACSNSKCRDPCPGVCGYRALCQVVNHSPICTCPVPLRGDPFIECKDIPAPPVDPCNPSPCGVNGQCYVNNGIGICTYPECIVNGDCPRDKACYAQKCSDPCVGACGLNALCRAVNHVAVCSCPAGYMGDAHIQCLIAAVEVPKPECVENNDCTNDKACINQKCLNPCIEFPNSCPQYAECRVQLHRPLCSCRSGYVSNSFGQCQEIGCRADSECPPIQACVNRQCEDPCSYTQCGEGAVCRTVSHRAQCECANNYWGNPLIGCQRSECVKDEDCPYHLACRGRKCEDPCNCAPGAQCTVNNHRPICRCPPGYIGDPSSSCTIAPIESVECKSDVDCASKLACFDGVCKNPCLETKPCGNNAKCNVVDSLPLRTMVCVCLPGFVGDADVECRPAPTEEPGCSSSDECLDSETCLNRACVNPCAVSTPCAHNADCRATGHRAVCRCPTGMVGNPFVNCYLEPTAVPECRNDADCPNDRACLSGKCQDPCLVANTCAPDAICRAELHRSVCSCPQGWGGDPKIRCYKAECSSDLDCPFDKACINGNCLNPCTVLTGESQCGRGAECRAQLHRAHCVCPAGTQGDAMVSCVTGICQYNEDCADHEACDRLNRVCRPVCIDEDSCGERAICEGRNHAPRCSCPPGTTGNPHFMCKEQPIPTEAEVECQQDADCSSGHACISSHCVNPCYASNPCSPDQECYVQDTLPLRTVMCKCPADHIIDQNGMCKRIVQAEPECRTDSNCPDTHRCESGTCVEVCRMSPCGVNAICNAMVHQATCSCAPGYQGNPYLECTNIPKIPDLPPAPECLHDDECPTQRACINQACINPCTVGDPCARTAFCHVENHKPVCRCPDGYRGNPQLNCVPITAIAVECTSHSDCSDQESCINGVCVNPCNCGPNAECRVSNHYPVCLCKPGYSGNPQYGCVRVGCQVDEECSGDKQCYNGECINPCIVNNPCAPNAMCHSDSGSHRAECRCPVGYEGDPFVRCIRIECRTDADCPITRACMDHRCIDPCMGTGFRSPCAPNANCIVRNHAAACRCPESMPIGDPTVFCEPRPPPLQPTPECKRDIDCPGQLACIGEKCLNPCLELQPCSPSSRCMVLETVPVRTMTCTCPEGWVPNINGECRPVAMSIPPGCTSNSDCSSNTTCINGICRSPCDCGSNAACFVNDHRPICSCEEGFEGNPNIACYAVGCRSNSECDSGKACVNGNCISPCLVNDPCGPNAECFAFAGRAECRCRSGYRGNPYTACHVVGCRSNGDCPSDRACIDSQCVSPCIHANPCAPTALDCIVRHHMAVCRCPPGHIGNPYVACRPEPRPECTTDADCPSVFACISSRCTEPCRELEPCTGTARCRVVPNTVPVRTMLCVCPDGYISGGIGICKPTTPVIAGCSSDTECAEDKSCVEGVCRNPCNCGLNSECRVVDHKPVCSCRQGYEGNPEIKCVPLGCRSDDECSSQHACENGNCVPVCKPDGRPCGTDATCRGANHRALCECLPGLAGDPYVSCTAIGCRSDSECPTTRACINGQCENPCDKDPCSAESAKCTAYNHRAVCSCPPGYIMLARNDAEICQKDDVTCRRDSDCPTGLACINSNCVNPCNETKPCGENADCRVLDTYPVRTMICECIPGYQGNAAVKCDKVAPCLIEKGYVRDVFGNCVCPPGSGLNENDDCILCPIEKGLKVDERGRCVCALERGMIVDERGNCVCPQDHGYHLDSKGNCVIESIPPGPRCTKDEDCLDNNYCDTDTNSCKDPCLNKNCGVNALCNATNHRAVCQCIAGYTGNPEVYCNGSSPFRTDFPRPDMVVSCLSDGVQVEIHITEQTFNGVLYVKGHSKDEQCRRVVTLAPDAAPRVEIFKVNFGSCGLIHVNAQAYHIKCVYTTGEKNVTLGFNVSMLTTAGTIANTGPPPICTMKIVTQTGQEIDSAEIGDDLILKVDVQPASIYGGFARSCIAKTMDDKIENEYLVTDEDGCATDPTIFGEWAFDPEEQSLIATFNAFKFPSSDNIRFQCNIRVCFGKCQPVNCRGYDAFGRRKREVREDVRVGKNGTDVDVMESTYEGQLREEITIQSNAILTLERKEERLIDPKEAPSMSEEQDICVSMIGFIIALVITALLALVAVAVAVSCWLMAYRRRPKIAGPLPHPPEFPNPLFTTPEPVAEPSPDYLS